MLSEEKSIGVKSILDVYTVGGTLNKNGWVLSDPTIIVSEELFCFF